MIRKLNCSLNSYINHQAASNVLSQKGKRLEENYKMVFKSAFKQMSSRFRIFTKGKRSITDQASFYQYYFSDISDNVTIPLESFFHPNRKIKDSDQKSSAHQKTMNSRYLENLMVSTKFCDDLISYLETSFVSAYAEKRVLKIHNFIEKLTKKFFSNSQVDIQALKYYLQQNSKCKLPWSNSELLIAKATVISLYNQRTAIQNAQQSITQCSQAAYQTPPHKPMISN